jgi:predicted negative regulator of RcsB-dependent stress response
VLYDHLGDALQKAGDAAAAKAAYEQAAAAFESAGEKEKAVAVKAKLKK